MRVFLCAFGNFSLAIPMRSVSSMMLYAKEAAQTVEINPENRNTYISLPRLLNLPLNTRHGIVLKKSDGNDGYTEDDDAAEDRTILITTEVVCETEIPDNEIYPVPKALSAVRFSALFCGIQFSLSDTAPLILLLDIEQLVRSIQKDSAA